jgi:multidrug resistance efflux pump
MTRTWLWTVMALVLLAAASYGLYVRLSPEPLPPEVLYGNGHVEGTEVAVSAEITGRVVETHLVEGNRVEAGNLLVRLEDADFRAALAQAEAEAAAVQQEKAAIEEQLVTARHHLRTAEEDLERYRKLQARGTVSPQRLGQAENVAEEARGRLQALEARLAATGDRLKAAREQVELARIRLEKTVILAPITGTVLVKAIELGELATLGRTVAVLVDLSRMDLKVFIPEKDIGKVELEDPARVRVDAFPDRLFEAGVARVDQRAQFTPRDIHMPEERVRLVFGVTLSLENPDSILKPGMPADAWILWPENASWPERLIVPK